MLSFMISKLPLFYKDVKICVKWPLTSDPILHFIALDDMMINVEDDTSSTSSTTPSLSDPAKDGVCKMAIYNIHEEE